MFSGFVSKAVAFEKYEHFTGMVQHLNVVRLNINMIYFNIIYRGGKVMKRFIAKIQIFYYNVLFTNRYRIRSPNLKTLNCATGHSICASTINQKFNKLSS